MTKKLPPDQVKYPRIHENDRHLIEHMWNDEKLTQSEIARKLNRSQSAISRELKQGNIFSNTLLCVVNLLPLKEV